MMSMDKEYTGTMKLGEETDSQDADGEVVMTREVPDLSEEQVRGAMKTFLGDQYQTPPMYSAKKVNGQPLYKLARKGKTVAREPRVIHVSKFELTDFSPPELSFLVGCSKGAYIRTVRRPRSEARLWRAFERSAPHRYRQVAYRKSRYPRSFEGSVTDRVA